MRALMKVGFSLLMLAFVLIGVSYGVLRAPGVHSPANAEGRTVDSETRSIGANVTAVELSGPINLTLRQAMTPSLEVRGEQRMLANVDTAVEGDTLHIGTRGIVLRHRAPLQVTLSLPSLAELRVDGSGDSSVSGFSGERIEVQLDGSGRVKFNGRFRQVAAALNGNGELEMSAGSSDKVEADVMGSGSMTLVGSARELRTEITGSGELDAQHLRADAVSVKQQGSGNTRVHARQSVAVALSGSGDVDVYGNPNQRSVSRTGSGDARFSD
jgi:Putative auto-transporter adhesin, head GIN domain